MRKTLHLNWWISDKSSSCAEAFQLCNSGFSLNLGAETRIQPRYLEKNLGFLLNTKPLEHLAPSCCLQDMCFLESFFLLQQARKAPKHLLEQLPSSNTSPTQQHVRKYENEQLHSMTPLFYTMCHHFTES